MMCDECGVRPANIHLTTLVGGEKQERNLCAVCMAKYKKQLPSIDLSSLAGLLGGFLEKAAGHKQAERDDTPDLICSRCNMSYAEFRRTGMLGCSDCYKAFHDPIEALLVRVHGNTQHNGRVPGGVDSQVALKLNMDKLKQRLVNAITNEEYEDAAQLRDQIRALKAQLSSKQAAGAPPEGGEA